jgi:hypothetical protein
VNEGVKSFVARTAPTSADEGVAEAATKLLADQGRPDVTVSPTQVKAWRERDALPRTSAPGRGQGLGRTATYPPGTEPIAAELALALDNAKSTRELTFDRAVLMAFSRGAEIPDDAVRHAYRRVFDGFIRKVKQARASSSRRQRLRLPGPRDELATRTAIELLTADDPKQGGASPPPHQVVEHTATTIAEQTGVNDLARVNDQDESISVLAGLLVRLNLAAMKRAALGAKVNDRRWAVSCARAFADLGIAWLHIRPLAREPGAEQRLVGQIFAAAGRLFADDLMVALAGPAFLVAAPTPAIRRRLDRYAEAARTEAPKLLASARAHLTASPSGDSFFSFILEPEQQALTR